MDNSINCNNDILDVIVNKETIVRKRIVSFLERVFDYLGFDFRHDIFKSIVYCEAEYVTETEAKFKMAFDAFVFLLLNRKNQLTTYVLNSFFQLFLGYKLDDSICYKICNKYFILYDETSIDKALLFSVFIYNELNMLKDEQRILIALIMLNYCLTTTNIPCIQFSNSEITKFIKLATEYNESLNISDLYLYIMEVIQKQKFQDLDFYNNLKPIDIKEVYSIIYMNRDYIKENFSVKNIYIFGSFAKGINRIDSDLDMLVSFDLDLLYDEREQIIEELKKYLFSLLNRFIDIHEFSNYLPDYSLTRKRKIKKIF